MKYQNAQSNYLANQIFSASPNRLIEILLENSIKQTKLAELALEKKQLQEVHNHLIKAQNIVTELEFSLNHEAGGEVSENLSELYKFIYQRLIDANISKEIDGITDAKKLLSELLVTWQQLIEE